MKPLSQTSLAIGDVATEIVVQSFADRVVVLVTQLGKVGCLIQATLPQTAQLPPRTPRSSNTGLHPPRKHVHASPPASIELTPLLGHPPSPDLHTFYNLLAAQLATIVWSSEEADGGSMGYRRGVIVGIALKLRSTDSSNSEDQGGRTSSETQFAGIADALDELLDGSSS